MRVLNIIILFAQGILAPEILITYIGIIIVSPPSSVENRSGDRIIIVLL